MLYNIIQAMGLQIMFDQVSVKYPLDMEVISDEKNTADRD